MKFDIPKFLDNLNPKQRQICESTENYVITACPGSGKTRTITYRLAYLQEKYKDSQKLNIAITYTNRAAEEIDKRLLEMNVDTDSIWTGTIHQFCMHFIIRPYAMYNDVLKNGYKIIDEYVSKEYAKQIADSMKISCGFRDPLTYPEIKREYLKLLLKKKEIDFELILLLSLKLVNEHPFIAENISYIIRSIHIDEFQDTNNFQYEIIAAIVKKNKHINVIFVGDVNQAIFGGLGGKIKTVEELEHLFEITFKKDVLSGCYRSTQRIINYYKNFEINRTGIYSVYQHKDINGIVSYDNKISKNDLVSKIAEVIKLQIKTGIPANEICVVAPTWYQILPFANELRQKLPDITFDAPEITPFKYDRLNPFYLFARLFFTESGVRVNVRKKIANELLTLLKVDYQINIPPKYDKYSLLKDINSCIPQVNNGITFFISSVKKVLSKMNIDISEFSMLNKTFENFINKANERITNYKIPITYESFCKAFKEKDGVVINTIHGVKGEEYNTVIAFGLLEGHLPHWDYIYKEDLKSKREIETNKLLYVLCSRAKQNLFLFSERGRLTQKGNEYIATKELGAIEFDYNLI